MPNNSSSKKSVFPSDQKSTPKCRKRKRSTSTEEDESDLDIESASAIEKKLRSVAKMNNLSSVEMKKLIKKLVVNDHVLAFITLKAEDELAREKDEAERIQTAAVIVNDVDPSVPKLTRAKARELNKPPMIALPSLMEPQTSEIASLIQEDLHSDEDDEEYTFKEEDFVSDEDPNLTASDVDSQPRTPMTPHQTQETESPQKFSEDGIFKIPREIELDALGDEIIATRTRSKFCLQQTTIEDIQSEFVPPDDHFDMTDADMYCNDPEWMDFLNTFSKPLNNSMVGDDDDPVNDPEYVAAEKVPFDAEELRDVNISKKELTELVAELFEGLLNEGVSMESIELETPKKFVESNKSGSPKNENNMTMSMDQSTIAARQLNFVDKPQTQISDATISSSNFHQNEFSFHPDVMSTPQGQVRQRNFTEELFVQTKTPCEENDSLLNPCTAFEVSYTDPSTTVNRVLYVPNPTPTIPIPTLEAGVDSSSQWGTIRPDRYIAARKLLKHEYVNKFERLKYTKLPDASLSEDPIGFTATQYQILQQQLRIHVQFLAQNFFQTYSHPDLWKIAPQQKRMLVELEENSRKNATFDVWNLKPAMSMVDEWEKELEEDSEDNARLMKFIYKEMRKVARTHNQVSRFSPRIMKKLLSSSVCMYPEYLPRIPFSAHPISFHMFAPSEAFLIAMGLEKHLNEILEHESNFSYMKRRTPLALACERMINSIIHGKTPRRLRDHINELKAATTYNPVKFYYEHNKAPPIEHNLIWIDFTNVLPPSHRINELPLVWKEFLQVLNAGGIVNNTYPENYSRYIKEITGEQIDFPLQGNSQYGNCSVKWAQRQNEKEKENEKPSVTININYLFGQSAEHLPGLDESHTKNLLSLPEPQNLSVCVSPLANTTNASPKGGEKQKKLTDYFDVQSKEIIKKANSPERLEKPSKKCIKSGFRLNRFSASYLGKKLQLTARRFRSAKNLQKRYENLLSAYRLSLEKQFAKYKHRGLRFVFRNCRALELYTNLLRDLKMNCKKAKPSEEMACKRKVGEGEEVPKSRKANRQEENLRHMLLPDSAEDANRKDAIYAFNFYEKVEEVLKQSNKPEDCKKFNHILRSFDPKKDKVADLYYKLEKLFLPDHPELAHVFLTFLLPPEAAEIGKFFEHFMYTNAGTFFNKLNVYFNKQPAQIRKIFNCISELSEDPDLTMEKMKSKIFPLLKGNTFLIDWFTQLFSSEPPPDRLFGSAENTNMKEVLSNQTGEYIETLHANDLLDSPTESQPCQLKYINGRIFYGTKIPLPAKLSFMAKSYQADELNESLEEEEKHTPTDDGCVHGIREYGENRLSASIHDCSSDDNDKSEEEDSKSQVMGAALEGEHFETCDEPTLRAHAIRLNPSYYSTSCYSSSQTTAPSSCHRPIKLASLITEDGKGSPRKAMSKLNPPATTTGTVSALKERRKSPKKSLVKSPLPGSKRSITDSSSKSNAIATAKKLKTLIDDEPNSDPDGSKKRLAKKRKESESKQNEESEITDGDIRLSPKEEIKEEVIQPWTRDEDKIILEEIKSGGRENLYQRISLKMMNRSLPEIEDRHRFLMDFLSKLQSNK